MSRRSSARRVRYEDRGVVANGARSAAAEAASAEPVATRRTMLVLGGMRAPRGEGVPLAPHGTDEFRAELATEPPDQYFEARGGGLARVTPHTVEEVQAGDHAAG